MPPSGRGRGRGGAARSTGGAAASAKRARAKEEEANVVCDVCRDGVWDEGDVILLCDGGCGRAVHQSCYGQLVVPAGDWLCDTCTARLRPTCAVCERPQGMMKRAGAPADAAAAGWMHVLCALTTPGIVCDDPSTLCPIRVWDAHALRACRGGVAAPCSLCGGAAGALLACAAPTCAVRFHAVCAADAEWRLELRTHTHKPPAFCATHALSYEFAAFLHTHGTEEVFGLRQGRGCVHFKAWYSRTHTPTYVHTAGKPPPSVAHAPAPTPTHASGVRVNAATAGKMLGRDGVRMRRAVQPEPSPVPDGGATAAASSASTDVDSNAFAAAADSVRSRVYRLSRAYAASLEAHKACCRDMNVLLPRVLKVLAELNSEGGSSGSSGVTLATADVFSTGATVADVVSLQAAVATDNEEEEDVWAAAARAFDAYAGPSAALLHVVPAHATPPPPASLLLTPPPAAALPSGRTMTGKRAREEPLVPATPDVAPSYPCLHTAATCFTLRVDASFQHDDVFLANSHAPVATSASSLLHPCVCFSAEADACLCAALLRSESVDSVAAARWRYSRKQLERWFPHGPALYVHGAAAVDAHAPLLLRWMCDETPDEPADDLNAAATRALDGMLPVRDAVTVWRHASSAATASDARISITTPAASNSLADARHPAGDVDEVTAELYMSLSQLRCVTAPTCAVTPLLLAAHIRACADAMTVAASAVVQHTMARVHAFVYEACYICGRPRHAPCAHRSAVLQHLKCVSVSTDTDAAGAATTAAHWHAELGRSDARVAPFLRDALATAVDAYAAAPVWRQQWDVSHVMDPAAHVHVFPPACANMITDAFSWGWIRSGAPALVSSSTSNDAVGNGSGDGAFVWPEYAPTLQQLARRAGRRSSTSATKKDAAVSEDDEHDMMEEEEVEDMDGDDDMYGTAAPPAARSRARTMPAPRGVAPTHTMLSPAGQAYARARTAALVMDARARMVFAAARSAPNFDAHTSAMHAPLMSRIIGELPHDTPSRVHAAAASGVRRLWAAAQLHATQSHVTLFASVQPPIVQRSVATQAPLTYATRVLLRTRTPLHDSVTTKLTAARDILWGDARMRTFTHTAVLREQVAAAWRRALYPHVPAAGSIAASDDLMAVLETMAHVIDQVVAAAEPLQTPPHPLSRMLLAAAAPATVAASIVASAPSRAGSGKTSVQPAVASGPAALMTWYTALVNSVATPVVAAPPPLASPLTLDIDSRIAATNTLTRAHARVKAYTRARARGVDAATARVARFTHTYMNGPYATEHAPLFEECLPLLRSAPREFVPPLHPQSGLQVHCLCATPHSDARIYIGCDGCGAWYHIECVHVSLFECDFHILSFACDACADSCGAHTLIRASDDPILALAHAGVHANVEPHWQQAYLGNAAGRAHVVVVPASGAQSALPDSSSGTLRVQNVGTHEWTPAPHAHESQGVRMDMDDEPAARGQQQDAFTASEHMRMYGDSVDETHANGGVHA